MLSLHPFPARMAPDLALSKLGELKRKSVVLDPMVGSGTVARQALKLGHTVIGVDLDPLAVLISKVSTTVVLDGEIGEAAKRLVCAATDLDPDNIWLPWLDGDLEGEAFVDYWFGARQRDDLRRLAYLLHYPAMINVSADTADVLRLALSRIIVTKAQCASLARDTSHSRPHKVAEESSYDIFDGFYKSVVETRKRLLLADHGLARITRGDARSLDHVEDESVGVVLTSPPYLNAIDYLRGHRMSLIWLGHKIADLSATRSVSIGSERQPDIGFDRDLLAAVTAKMGDTSALPPRFRGIIDRYVGDLYRMAEEVRRVLKPSGTATFVMGDSCLKGVFIRNSDALLGVAVRVGLRLTDRVERDLPAQHRYLPMPKGGALSKSLFRIGLSTCQSA
jgi:DNA modification methylase